MDSWNLLNQMFQPQSRGPHQWWGPIYKAGTFIHVIMWGWRGQESVRKGGRDGSDEGKCDYVILICMSTNWLSPYARSSPPWTSESGSTPTYTQTALSAIKRPHPNWEENRSWLQDPLWGMQQSVHWANLQGTGPMNERAQDVSDIRKCGTVSSSRACHGWDACDQLRRGTGGGQPSTLHPAVHSGGLAHQVRENNLNRDVGPLPSTYNCLIFSTIPS